MKKLFIGLALLSSFSSFAENNNSELLLESCNVRYYSVDLNLVADMPSEAVEDLLYTKGYNFDRSNNKDTDGLVISIKKDFELRNVQTAQGEEVSTFQLFGNIFKSAISPLIPVKYTETASISLGDSNLYNDKTTKYTYAYSDKGAMEDFTVKSIEALPDCKLK